jgi:tetratricopeptide (TPR) repeat protein
VIFQKKNAPYDRRAALEKASKLRGKGKNKKALAAFLVVLEHEPEDHETWSRVASLQLGLKQREAAAASFRKASAGQAAAGFWDKAISLLRQSADANPLDEEPWVEIGELHLKKERPREAVRALLEGRERFRRRRDRPRALRLLRRAHELAPDVLMIGRDLARLLKKTGARAEGYVVLEELLERADSPARRREIRWVQFRLFPSPATLWRALRGA